MTLIVRRFIWWYQLYNTSKCVTVSATKDDMQKRVCTGMISNCETIGVPTICQRCAWFVQKTLYITLNAFWIFIILMCIFNNKHAHNWCKVSQGKKIIFRLAKHQIFLVIESSLHVTNIIILYWFNMYNHVFPFAFLR